MNRIAKSSSRAGLACLIVLLPALAAAGDWEETYGARLRLVTVDAPDADGVLRGALQIELEPGWKTYWRDPGDSGVPPSVSVKGNENVAAATIEFPPPGRHSDGYGQFAGYDEPVSLALSFEVADPDGALAFTADVFLGVCETICIPVRAEFDVDPASASAENEAVVEAAFAALAPPPREGFKASFVEFRDGRMIVQAELPEPGMRADLFVASTQNRMFGLAELIQDGDRPIFEVPYLANGGTGPEEADYTLVGDGAAVTGRMTIESR
jgi:DsbC/DsbD-like thiol-disulfide interchange protein